MLNGRISNFDYNSQDATNRPSHITETKLKDDTRSLKQYAAQYWCLLRKLPLLIGDMVPTGDRHWGLLLQLLDVVDMIMSPKVNEEMLSYLEMQLLVLFSEFKKLFPEVSITPKMHYTLHYPRLMRHVGPLIRHWVMRFEAKHHFFNVAKTLATRHQLLQVVHANQGTILTRDVVVTDGFPVASEDYDFGAKAAAHLKCSRFTVCKKAVIHGTTYKEGSVILTGFDEDNSVRLEEIVDVCVSGTKNICFVISELDVDEYCEHFHSWKAARPKDPQVTVVPYDCLADHSLVGIHHSFGSDSSMYANLRYNITPVK